MTAVGTSPNAGVERIAAAFAGSGKRAALMPYLMGGFPDVATSRAIGEAYADGGADLVELGVPFSDPLADGPVIQAAGSRALAAFREVTRLEGIIPALETAHAFHYVLHEPSDSDCDLLCLSGRGDKDLAEVLAQ